MINNLDYIIKFGKYKNQTIEYLLQNNIKYLNWLKDIHNPPFDDNILNEIKLKMKEYSRISHSISFGGGDMICDSFQEGYN